MQNRGKKHIDKVLKLAKILNLYVCSDKVGLLSVSPSSVRLLAEPLKLDVSVNYGAGRLTSQGYEG